MKTFRSVAIPNYAIRGNFKSFEEQQVTGRNLVTKVGRRQLMQNPRSSVKHWISSISATLHFPLRPRDHLLPVGSLPLAKIILELHNGFDDQILRKTLSVRKKYLDYWLTQMRNQRTQAQTSELSVT